MRKRYYVNKFLVDCISIKSCRKIRDCRFITSWQTLKYGWSDEIHLNFSSVLACVLNLISTINFHNEKDETFSVLKYIYLRASGHQLVNKYIFYILINVFCSQRTSHLSHCVDSRLVCAADWSWPLRLKKRRNIIPSHTELPHRIKFHVTSYGNLRLASGSTYSLLLEDAG